jgi:hypothetical protein
VLLNHPIPRETPETPSDAFSIGYFKNFGVSARSLEAAQALIANAIEDGRIDWSASEWSEVEGPPPHEGIWFESGRLLFTEHPAGEKTT